MHDPKFEKEVQQKLEELSFSPSEAVWANVDRAVNGGRKRRTPLFWFWTLPAVALTVAGIWFFTGKEAPAGSHIKANAPVPAASAPVVASAPAASSSMPSASSTMPSSSPVSSISSTHSTIPAASSSAPAKTSIIPATPSSKRGSSTVPPASSATPASYAVTPTAPGTASITAATSTSAHTGIASLPALNLINKQYASPKAARLSSRNQATAASTKAPIQLKPKYAWETGFGAGIGVSSLNKTLFQQPAAVMSDLRPNVVVINGAPKSFSSRIRPDLSWWAGIVAERPLNKRLSLALGLNFHYYSTKIQIGDKVTSAPQYNYAAQSLFNTPGSQYQAAAAYPYYPVGNTDEFTNRYFFLELPASVLWQINHSRTMPLFWESGMSFSYLVSSSALSYDAKSTVFYKDGSTTNKVQANLSTALLVGLPIKGMRLQAGPQIQYGVTTLQHDGSTGQHLFYGGLRVILLPGKKK